LILTNDIRITYQQDLTLKEIVKTNNLIGKPQIIRDALDYYLRNHEDYKNVYQKYE